MNSNTARQVQVNALKALRDSVKLGDEVDGYEFIVEQIEALEAVKKIILKSTKPCEMASPKYVGIITENLLSSLEADAEAKGVGNG